MKFLLFDILTAWVPGWSFK